MELKSNFGSTLIISKNKIITSMVDNGELYPIDVFILIFVSYVHFVIKGDEYEKNDLPKKLYVSSHEIRKMTNNFDYRNIEFGDFKAIHYNSAHSRRMIQVYVSKNDAAKWKLKR